MKFWEAMRELEAGKSVRLKEWPSTAYWSFKQSGQLWMGIVDLFILASKEWELYEEPQRTLSFMEVVQGLKEGKRFKRPKWPNEMSFGTSRYTIQSKDRPARINLYGGEPWDLTVEDFEATDWIEVP